MFELRTDIKHIQTSKEHLVAIIESINQPMVAASGRSAEATKAYIVGVRNASGLFSIYVYLYLVKSSECLIYLNDPAEFAMEDYHDVELEALGFVESMGFMVDNTNFRNLQPAQQDETMASMPVFQVDLAAFGASRPSANEETAGGEGEDAVDLSPLEDDIIELDEVAEEIIELGPPVKVISPEGLAKIIRMFSSF